MQSRLSALGYEVGPSGVDGVFADQTEAAVKDFQGRCDLPEDGIVDGATWRALVDATRDLGERVLYLRAPNFHGKDVRELQRRLNSLGFDCGENDGVFGRQTYRAVVEFQRNYGMPADGIVGDATYRALENLRHMYKDKDGKLPAEKRAKKIPQPMAAPGRRVSIVAEDPLSRELAARISSLFELSGCFVEAEQSTGEFSLRIGARTPDEVTLELKRWPEEVLRELEGRLSQLMSGEVARLENGGFVIGLDRSAEAELQRLAIAVYDSLMPALGR